VSNKDTLFLRRGSGGEEVLAQEEAEEKAEEEEEEEEGKEKRIRVTSSLTCASSVLVNMVEFIFAHLLGAFCSLSSIL
jgi:hypothetical protein